MSSVPQRLKNNRGLLQHQRTCKVTLHIISNNGEDTQTTTIEKQNINYYGRNTSGVVITSPMINQRDNLEPPAETDFTLVWGNHSSGDLKEIINTCYEEIVDLSSGMPALLLLKAHYRSKAKNIQRF